MAQYDFSNYDKLKTAKYVAGLLVEPKYHANTYRIELLIHHILSDCTGNENPTSGAVSYWLNQYEPIAELHHQEDPVESMFISRVPTVWGNYRIYNGIWEGNSFFLKAILDVVKTIPANFEIDALFDSIKSMLKLSEALVARNKGRHNDLAKSHPWDSLSLPTPWQLQKKSDSLYFSKKEISLLGILWKDLLTFIADESQFRQAKEYIFGKSAFLKSPIIIFEDGVLVLFPASISWAIRFFIFKWIQEKNLLSSFYARHVFLYYRTLRELPGLGMFVPKDPPYILNKPLIDDAYYFEFCAQFDKTRAIHFIVRIDSLAGLEQNGVDELPPKAIEQQQEIERRIEKCKNEFLKPGKITEGLSLVVMAGYGRANSFTITYDDSNWSVACISMDDLQVLSWQPNTDESTLYRLIKFQDAIREMDIMFMNVNGLLNLYGWWKASNGTIVPLEVNVGHKSRQIISIPTNSLAKMVRNAVTMVDEQMVPWVNGEMKLVRRNSINSFFSDARKSRLYVDFGDNSEGIFTGCALVNCHPWWVHVQNTTLKIDRKLAHRIYDAVLYWTGHIANHVERVHPRTKGMQPVLVNLNLSLLEPVEILPSDTSQSMERIVQTTLDFEGRIVSLFVQQEFLNCLHNPINYSERAIIIAIIEGYLRLEMVSYDTAFVMKLVAAIVPSNYSRHIHGFIGKGFRENIRHFYGSKYRVINEFDSQIFKIGLGHFQTPGEKNFSGRSNCTKFINNLVAHRYRLLRSELKKFNRSDFIFAILSNIEALDAEKTTWERTARAVLNLHHTQSEVFDAKIKHFAEITIAEITCRILIEIAICECPLFGGGRVLGEFDYSHLMAQAMVIFHFGNLSDGIEKEVVPADLHIPPNGDVRFEQSFYEEIFQPAVSKYESDRTIRHSEDYEKSFSQPKETIDLKGLHGEQFLAAWRDEFGVDIESILDFLDVLYEIGFEREARVFRILRSEILKRALNKDHLNSDVVNQILSAFSLESRERWEEPPSGYERRDINPWLFRRRLSVISKPLLLIDKATDPCYIISPGFVVESLLYMIELYGSCGLEETRCKSDSMKKYIGDERVRRGQNFTLKVAATLKSLGYHTLTEVRVSSILSSKGLNKDYGDFDVIAWKDTEDTIHLIECKNLIFAKTVSEVAEQVQEYRGNLKANGEPDKLKRHTERVELMIGNTSSLLKYLRLSGIKQVMSHLVFSRPVPILFNKMIPRDVQLHSLDSIEENKTL